MYDIPMKVLHVFLNIDFYIPLDDSYFMMEAPKLWNSSPAYIRNEHWDC